MKYEFNQTQNKCHPNSIGNMVVYDFISDF